MAVASGSAPAAIEAILTGTGLAAHLTTVVSADEVAHRKPAGQSSSKRRADLEADPADCVVLEDAPLRRRTAHAAGMRCIAVRTSRQGATTRRFATAGLLLQRESRQFTARTASTGSRERPRLPEPRPHRDDVRSPARAQETCSTILPRRWPCSSAAYACAVSARGRPRWTGRRSSSPIRNSSSLQHDDQLADEGAPAALLVVGDDLRPGRPPGARPSRPACGCRRRRRGRVDVARPAPRSAPGRRRPARREPAYEIGGSAPAVAVTAAPSATATCTAKEPTPPAPPCTSTRAPGRRPPCTDQALPR